MKLRASPSIQATRQAPPLSGSPATAYRAISLPIIRYFALNQANMLFALDLSVFLQPFCSTVNTTAPSSQLSAPGEPIEPEPLRACAPFIVLSLGVPVGWVMGILCGESLLWRYGDTEIGSNPFFLAPARLAVMNLTQRDMGTRKK